METSESPQASDAPPVLFRPSKKRKAYRQKTEDSSGLEPGTTNADNDRPPTGDAVMTAVAEQPAEEDVSVAEAIRLRNARRLKHRGVEFRQDAGSGLASDMNAERGLVLLKDGEQVAPPAGITGRFAPQTGIIGELVNKHM